MTLHLRASGCHLPRDHTVVPARQASARFIYPGGMERWVDLDDWLHTLVTYRDGLSAGAYGRSPFQVVTQQRTAGSPTP